MGVILGVILGLILTPPGGVPGGPPAPPAAPPRGARNFPPRNFPAPPDFRGADFGPPTDDVREGGFGRFPYNIRVSQGGPPQTPQNGQKRPGKKCPILSRLGELLNTLRNVHIFRRRPGGPPGGPPRTPPPGGSYGGVPRGVSGRAVRMAQTTPPDTPPLAPPH